MHKDQAYTHWATYTFPCESTQCGEVVEVHGVHGTRWRLGPPRHLDGGTGASWTPLLEVGNVLGHDTKDTNKEKNTSSNDNKISTEHTMCKEVNSSQPLHEKQHERMVRAFPTKGKLLVVLPSRGPPLGGSSFPRTHTTRAHEYTIEAMFQLPACETKQLLEECQHVVWLTAGRLEGPSEGPSGGQGGAVVQLRLERAAAPRERVEGTWLVYQPTRGAIAFADDW